MEWNPSHIAMPPEPLQDEYHRTDCKDGNRDLINRRTTVADLRMIQSTNFPRGLGMEIHIRTTARHDYNFIDDVALKIGDDILQVSSNGKYMINGVHQASLPAKMAGLFHVTHTKIHGQRHEFYIEIAESEFLVISTFGEMINIRGRIRGFRGTGEVGNDCVTVMDHLSAFGQSEWKELESTESILVTPMVVRPIRSRYQVPSRRSTRRGIGAQASC